MARDKVRVTDFTQMKAERRPIAMLTAYDFPFARIFDAAGVDVLLVGDSLGMVVQGADSSCAGHSSGRSMRLSSVSALSSAGCCPWQIASTIVGVTNARRPLRLLRSGAELWLTNVLV